MINYRQLSFLLIDDFPEFRVSLKGMVNQMGGIDIELASTGEAALSKCAKKRYDIILSDYNLGEGKDGQQVLEELTQKELLKPTSVYVMVTAENTMEMVMGALEHTPDSYLTKPFTKALLQSRLDKLLTKKIELAKVNQAIISKDYSKAIVHCNLLIQKGSKYSMSCMRIKADLYDKMGDFGQSRVIYQKVIKERPLPWALMGLGKILYAQDDFSEALALFDQVIKIMATYPEALDWLASTKQALGQPEDAQRALESAVKVSPKAIFRQMHLGDIALVNGDIKTARRAFKAAVKLGRTSVYKTPDNYLKLASILKEFITEESGINNKRIVDEAMRALKELETDYELDPEIQLRANLARHAIYHKLNKQDQASELLAKSKLNFTKIQDKMSGMGCADMAQACKDGEDFETCQEILANIMEKFGDDKELMANLETIVEDKAAFEQAVKASKINNKGMKASVDNDIDGAIDGFKEALAMSPENISFNMNLAQMLLRKAESIDDKKQLLMEVDTCLNKTASLRETDHRFVRCQQLIRMFNDYSIGLQA